MLVAVFIIGDSTTAFESPAHVVGTTDVKSVSRGPAEPRM